MRRASERLCFCRRITSLVRPGGALTGFEWNKIDSSIPLSGTPGRAFFYEPRFGMAYDIFGTGKTVLRGGWGQYRYHDEQNVQAPALQLAAGAYTYTVTPPSGVPTTFDYISTVTASEVAPWRRPRSGPAR